MIDREEVARLYQSGLSTIQVAAALNCAANTVMHHLKSQSIARRPLKRIDWPIEQMRKWYEEDGWTLQQIADQIGQKQKVVNKVAKKHGFRMRRTGPPSGAVHPGWKGGRHLDKTGYVLVYLPDHPAAQNGYYREHRLVMEAVLGRYLTKDEVVHHKNDNKQDNDPENLVLYSSNGAHLAETLAGKCPQWTPEGRARILQAVRSKSKRRKRRAPDGPVLPSMTAHSTDESDTGLRAT